MITRHQFLDRYPIDPNSERLILGTIHPHHHGRFLLPFFYGNKLSLWKILNEAFDNEIGADLRLDNILRFLTNHRISVSDTIVECRRLKPTAFDQDLIPLVLNHSLVEAIRESKIREILFTSGYQKNAAFRLFYSGILGFKISAAMRKQRQMMLDREVFGRPVKLTILYSPSGASNVPVSMSDQYLAGKDRYAGSKRPVHDFKVDDYRRHFS
jgi:hypothetical protein